MSSDKKSGRMAVVGKIHYYHSVINTKNYSGQKMRTWGTSSMVSTGIFWACCYDLGSDYGPFGL